VASMMMLVVMRWRWQPIQRTHGHLRMEGWRGVKVGNVALHRVARIAAMHWQEGYQVSGHYRVRSSGRHGMPGGLQALLLQAVSIVTQTSLDCAIPVVLDGIVGAPRQVLCDFSPFVAKLDM
jgi:hypothetical protein